jgi:signal transduction histidine kinase
LAKAQLLLRPSPNATGCIFNQEIEMSNDDGDRRPVGIDHSNRISDVREADVVPELRIYSHSNIIYWWPIWLFGFICALITYVGGINVLTPDGREMVIHPNPAVGITFTTVLVFVLTFTNVRLRGYYSLFFALFVAFIIVLFGWLGWWEDIFALIPLLSVHMNLGFYLVLSAVVFIIWVLRFFIFDRLQVWRITPGQLTVEQVIGGAEDSYDTRGMLFEERADDFFRHYMLGLGAGDLHLTTSGAKQTEMYIPNVLFAHRKVQEMQRLINIQPSELMPRA